MKNTIFATIVCGLLTLCATVTAQEVKSAAADMKKAPFATKCANGCSMTAAQTQAAAWAKAHATKPVSAKAIEAAFKQADKDGDGTLAGRELNKFDDLIINLGGVDGKKVRSAQDR